LVGTGGNSWEEAAKNALETAAKTLGDLRIAAITKREIGVEKAKVISCRARVRLSFKCEGGE
jgi:flavin-binding protein dodecin